MKTKKKATILYCSGFLAHRTHRELVSRAAEYNWIINSVPWHDSAKGNYTGGIPCDGIISHLSPSLTQKLMRNTGNTPHVTLNAQTAQEFRLPGSVLNHREGGRVVARHFIELGFKNLLAIGHLKIDNTFDERFAGYSEEAIKASLPSPYRLSLSRQSSQSYPKSVEAFGEAIVSLPKPLAIMASNDRTALRIIHACWHEDISMPSQVAICGFDNDPIACDLAPIPLSSVDTNPELQADRAIKLMRELLENQEASELKTVIDPAFIEVRRSSGLVASKNLVIAKALASIERYLTDPTLSIQDIALDIGTSKRNLFSSFKRELQTTPLNYITNLRIKKAQRLLKITNMKISDIRPQCGFASDYQMYQAFKRTTGKAPGSFKHHS